LWEKPCGVGRQEGVLGGEVAGFAVGFEVAEGGGEVAGVVGGVALEQGHGFGEVLAEDAEGEGFAEFGAGGEVEAGGGLEEFGVGGLMVGEFGAVALDAAEGPDGMEEIADDFVFDGVGGVESFAEMVFELSKKVGVFGAQEGGVGGAETVFEGVLGGAGLALGSFGASGFASVAAGGGGAGGGGFAGRSGGGFFIGHGITPLMEDSPRG
jgi:hypothetical protein